MNLFSTSCHLWCQRECQSASHLSPRQISWGQDDTSVGESGATVVVVVVVVCAYLRARAEIFQEPISKYNLTFCHPPPAICPEVGSSALITMHKIRLALLSADGGLLHLSRCHWKRQHANLEKGFCIETNEIRFNLHGTSFTISIRCNQL